MNGKANNGKGNVPERDEWETPKWLFDILKKQYYFEYDCCASQKNSKCKYFSSKRLPFGLSTKINKTCWMNPPFSKANEMFKHFFDVVDGGVAIYRCDNMETKIWQEVILPNVNWIIIPNKRIVYEGMEGKGSRFPSALIGFNVEKPKNINGVILKIIKKGEV